jgi:tRNA(Ile)-lysidine synthase TilS/MesJ
MPVVHALVAKDEQPAVAAAVAQWPPIARAHAAILLDQMVRNAGAVDAAPEGLKEAVDSVAVALAVEAAAELTSSTSVSASASASASGATQEEGRRSVLEWLACRNAPITPAATVGGLEADRVSAAEAAARDCQHQLTGLRARMDVVHDRYVALAETSSGGGGGPDAKEGGGMLVANGEKGQPTPAPSSTRAVMTAAEFAFLTLVLRHTRQLALLQESLSLLQRALAGELAAVVAVSGAVGGGGVGDNSGASAGEALLARFVEETTDSLLAVQAEEYISRALTAEFPTLLTAPTGTTSNTVDTMAADNQRMGVLDQKCVELVGSDRAKFLPLFGDGAGAAAVGPDHPLCKHWVTVELSKALAEAKVGPSHTLILSLSGGVDSMAHAVMLRLLQPTYGYDLCAVHIRHPNRDDAVDEEQWVTHAAAKIGLELYSHRAELVRPHGTTKTGLSRERYEQVTKKIRFRMYEVVAQAPARQNKTALVVMGHHLDDADENRLAELGKGNIVDVNGMRALSECLCNTVYRPLLRLRKDAMYEFAQDAVIPYMADSTPRWSKRGWTRQVLDECPEATRGPLLQHLDQLGNASAELADEIEKQLVLCGAKVCTGSLPDLTGSAAADVGADPKAGAGVGQGEAEEKAAVENQDSSSSSARNGGGKGKGKNKSKSDGARDVLGGGPVAFLDLGKLEHFVRMLEPSILRVLSLVAAAADVWNVAVAEYTAAVAATHADAGTCPLQPIRMHSAGQFDPGTFLFTLAVKELLRKPAANCFLNGGQVAGKALAHLWRSLQGRRTGAVALWGLMHLTCPFAWSFDRPGVLLFPIALNKGVMALDPNGTARRRFIARCLATMPELELVDADA